MIAIEEMERRIIAELQEAGQENIAAMINTIIVPSGDAGEVAALRKALDKMVREGLVTMALDPGPGKGLVSLSEHQSLAIIEKIDALLRFRASDNHWTWSESLKPHIVVTAEGRTRADEILDQYGYQWWRQKN